jgi:2-alkenal reductase
LISFAIVGVVAGVASAAVTTLLLDGDGASLPPAASQDSITQAADKALPSVVTIINDTADTTNDAGLIVDAQGVGSGVIIDTRGYIVTNEHVIHEPGTLTVVLENGRELPAERVSDDAPFNDLAVVKIIGDVTGLQALPFADSNDLVLGQTVLAIGSALYEYRNSVTVGAVSGLHRRWLRQDVYMEDLIQTDAAINNGNSGGPLVNLNGEIVGLASTIVRQLGQNNTVWGVSFAISSRTMRPITQAIIKDGKYPRPYFGIEHGDISLEFAAQQKLTIDHGAMVLRVIGGSPADRAGLVPGDIVTRIGENEVTPEMPFINALSRVGVNDRITIQVWRDNRLWDVPLQVEPR